MLIDFLKGKWLKHPLHPIIVHIPLALWPAALIFDLLTQFGFGGNPMVRLSFYCILFGLIAVLLAVPTGVVDWAGIKKERPAWNLGLYHMVANLVVAIIYAMNLGLRLETVREASAVELLPVLLSLVGVVLLAGSAYLGGLMIYDHGISVARLSKEKWRKSAEAGHGNVPPRKEEKS